MIENLWYKSTIIYSLDLETFLDANGDGVGDFEGLSRGLDYLEALGVDTVWLAPFQPTPNRDNGYDITDFYGIDSRHGSSGDFVEFMHEARERGIRVVMDLLVNHTSDQHPWFQAARRSEDSPHRNWYVWSRERPEDWDKGMVFPGVQQATWTLDEIAGAYYFHRFYEFQPDLNADNPEVRKEIRRAIGYWLELGVAGFRVDAVPFFIESTVPGEKRTDLHFEYIAEIRRFLQWRCGDAILLGEANVLPEEMQPYFGKHDEGLQMMFNFYVNQHLFYALATGEVAPLVESLQATRGIPQTAQWAHFLRNHDELDLGRLSKKQREAVMDRFAPQENMRIYDRGIRRRLASMLGHGQQLRMAYSVLFSLPGTPVLRYGDEIGMSEDLSLRERDAVRTPMQWSHEPQAGFSTATELVHPVIDEGPHGYKTVNVTAQQRDPDSLLNWTAAMIRLRKECPEIGSGDWEILDIDLPNVLAMRYEWRDNSLVILHNFGDQPQSVRFHPGADPSERLVNLLVGDDSTADANGTHRVELEGYGYRWFRVGDRNHLLHYTRV